MTGSLNSRTTKPTSYRALLFPEHFMIRTCITTVFEMSQKGYNQETQRQPSGIILVYTLSCIIDSCSGFPTLALSCIYSSPWLQVLLYVRLSPHISPGFSWVNGFYRDGGIDLFTRFACSVSSGLGTLRVGMEEKPADGKNNKSGIGMETLLNTRDGHEHKS